MISSSHSQNEVSPLLLKFLKLRIGLSDNAISLGIRQSKIEQAPLAVVLWSFGLIDLQQYQQVLEWKKYHGLIFY